MATKFKSALLIATIICAIFIALSCSAQEDKKLEKGDKVKALLSCSSIRDKAKSGEKISDSEKTMLAKCAQQDDEKPSGRYLTK